MVCTKSPFQHFDCSFIAGVPLLCVFDNRPTSKMCKNEGTKVHNPQRYMQCTYTVMCQYTRIQKFGKDVDTALRVAPAYAERHLRQCVTHC